jgi:ATP phosphoribosyltransferase
VKNGIADPQQLSGGRVVTSFPNLTRAFFDKFDGETGKQTSECVFG